jgi:hypothetical protein
LVQEINQVGLRGKGNYEFLCHLLHDQDEQTNHLESLLKVQLTFAHFSDYHIPSPAFQYFQLSREYTN